MIPLHESNVGDHFDAIGALRDGFTVSNLIADCLEASHARLETLSIFQETNDDPDNIVPSLKDILSSGFVLLFEIFLFSPTDKYMEDIREFLTVYGKSCIYKMTDNIDPNMDRILLDWGCEPVSNCFALMKDYDLQNLKISDIHRVVVRDRHSLRLLRIVIDDTSD